MPFSPSQIPLIIFCLIAGVLAFNPSAQAQSQALKEIVRPGQNPIRIAVESSNSQLVSLGRQALGLHGAFDVATAKSANWVLTLQGSGNNVQYTVRAPDGGATKSRGTASGADLFGAFCKAMDAMVRDLTGTPGFFTGTLAFVAEPTGKPEIYLSDILFRSVKTVTDYRSNVVTPRWSPDGTRLIYTSYAQSGYPDIVVQNLAKKTLRPVANYRGVNLGGSFSPDGRAIAFVASSSGSPEIYIARPDGSGARRQTWTKGLAATPSWSPDSKRIVFVSDDWGGPQLILLDIAKKANSRIRTGLGGYNVEPDWNPVYDDLVAFTTRAGGEFQIALYSFSENRAVVLTRTAGSSVEPAWLSDGRHLVYTYRHKGNKQLRILDVQTKRTANLHSAQLAKASQADFTSVPR